jgi:hypothetical protein
MSNPQLPVQWEQMLAMSEQDKFNLAIAGAILDRISKPDAWGLVKDKLAENNLDGGLFSLARQTIRNLAGGLTPDTIELLKYLG